ncbi:hypothetical protein RR46_04601 [Papilio xuthus]|uniref:Uncharacterized protein n=1 Tax=Papilio xuthus TaxID=66420 RepID=A0A194Q012_PAPXU|nr:hypothetical protein RR46_04601 [Papilio xuthus]
MAKHSRIFVRWRHRLVSSPSGALGGLERSLSSGPHPRNNTSPTHPDEGPPMGSKLVGAATGRIY